MANCYLQRVATIRADRAHVTRPSRTPSVRVNAILLRRPSPLPLVSCAIENNVFVQAETADMKPAWRMLTNSCGAVTTCNGATRAPLSRLCPRIAPRGSKGFSDGRERVRVVGLKTEGRRRKSPIHPFFLPFEPSVPGTSLKRDRRFDGSDFGSVIERFNYGRILVVEDTVNQRANLHGYVATLIYLMS